MWAGHVCGKQSTAGWMIHLPDFQQLRCPSATVHCLTRHLDSQDVSTTNSHNLTTESIAFQPFKIMSSYVFPTCWNVMKKFLKIYFLENVHSYRSNYFPRHEVKYLITNNDNFLSKWSQFKFESVLNYKMLVFPRPDICVLNLRTFPLLLHY